MNRKAPAMDERVRDAIDEARDLAVTAEALERGGDRAAAGAMYQRAVELLLGALPGAPEAQRPYLALCEDLLTRAERLRAERLFARRPPVRRAEEGPRAVGQFVAAAGTGGALVQCLLLALGAACSADQAPLDPSAADFYARVATLSLAPDALLPALRAPRPMAVRVHHPHVFAHLRRLGSLALGASLADARGLYALQSPGKSGASMWFTPDMRFVLKTISAEEMLSADALAPHYLAHVCSQPHSLLCRMAGIFTLALPGAPANAASEQVMRVALGQSARDLYGARGRGEEEGME